MENKLYSLILLKLRERKGMYLRDLLPVLPSEYLNMDYSAEFLIFDLIFDLMRWELVEAYKDGRFISVEDLKYVNRSDWPRDIEYYISKQAIDIEKAFGISFNLSASMIFSESRTHLENFPNILVLMPFSEYLKPVYENHIIAAAIRVDLKVDRADNIFSNGLVMSDVWTGIKKAKIIIADCTGRNPNVFYEIGIAHALGKETILITQSMDDIPFDLRHLRVILYKYPDGVKAFEETLFRTIEAVLKK